MDAHRRHLTHTEMVHAFTTAAVINYSFAPPKEPVEPRAFMPNLKADSDEHSEAPAHTPKFTQDELLDWQTRIANLAAEMKAGGGPLLDQLQRNPETDG